VNYFPWFIAAPLTSFFVIIGLKKYFPIEQKPLHQQIFSPRICPHCKTAYNSNPTYCYVCGNLLSDHHEKQEESRA
jgi:hypothetical protein